MCINSKYALVRYDYERIQAYISILPCKSWGCVDCAEYKRKMHQARIIYATKESEMSSSLWSFLTLTSHERVRGNSESIALITNAWPKLRKRIAREYGKFEYVMIFERHKAGAYHAHLLVSVFVSTRWLRRNCRQLGLGYMAKAIKLNVASSAGKYVSKYLAKSLSDSTMPKRFKRVRYSQGFPQLPKGDKVITQYEVIDKKSINMWRLGLMSDGYEVKLSEEARVILESLIDTKRRKVYA